MLNEEKQDKLAPYRTILVTIPETIESKVEQLRESYFSGLVGEIMKTYYNPSVPQPDPNWDYYELWRLIHQARKKLEDVINEMSLIESASNSTDESLRKKVRLLSVEIGHCRQWLEEPLDIDELLED